MSAERGWIVESPPPQMGWRDSHYSRMADKIAAKLCPYYAETIKSAAIKCRYCGSNL